MRIFTWPFALAGGLIAFLLSVVGRFITFIIGLVTTIFGVGLCLSVLGLILGIPLTGFGFALMARSIF